MNNKNISIQSNHILTYFILKGKDCFDFFEAGTALPKSSKSALKELLSDMVRRGLLMRIKRGLYYLIPYEKEPEFFMPDWHLIAEQLVTNAEYYIGYYSALQIHNLITQPSLKEQIVVSKQIRPSAITIRNVDFQFIYHNKSHFFGCQKTWIDSYTKVYCSDLEKTLVDCLFRPSYAGGITEIAKAIYSSRDKIKFNKLLEYAERFDSQAVIKRLGFLLEVLSIDSSIIQNLNHIRTASYVLLDPELPKSGKLISRWRIQQNLDTETIKSALFT